jgi:hypothetical protein
MKHFSEAGRFDDVEEVPDGSWRSAEGGEEVPPGGWRGAEGGEPVPPGGWRGGEEVPPGGWRGAEGGEPVPPGGWRGGEEVPPGGWRAATPAAATATDLGSTPGAPMGELVDVYRTLDGVGYFTFRFVRTAEQHEVEVVYAPTSTHGDPGLSESPRGSHCLASAARPSLADARRAAADWAERAWTQRTRTN